MTAAFAQLFDDAAIFPPGNAPVDVAVKDHVARAATPDGLYVGPLVCDVARVPDLLAVAAGPLRVSLVGAAEEVALLVRGSRAHPSRSSRSRSAGLSSACPTSTYPSPWRCRGVPASRCPTARS